MATASTLDLSLVRTALATSLGTIQGLRVYDIVPASVQPPCVIVGLPKVWEWDQASGNALIHTQIPLLIAVGRAEDKTSQALISGFLTSSGSTSIKAAVELDRTLSGACQTLRVATASNFGLATFAGTEHLSCELLVEVYG